MRDQRRALGWSTLLLLAACTPADDRCAAIDEQELRAKYHALSEERFTAELFGSLPSGYSHDQYLLAKRSMRAAESAEFKAEMRLKYPDIPMMWEADAVKDSADPDPQPPPTPSQRDWYAENCWEGKAR